MYWICKFRMFKAIRIRRFLGPYPILSSVPFLFRVISDAVINIPTFPTLNIWYSYILHLRSVIFLHPTFRSVTFLIPTFLTFLLPADVFKLPLWLSQDISSLLQMVLQFVWRKMISKGTHSSVFATYVLFVRRDIKLKFVPLRNLLVGP